MDFILRTTFFSILFLPFIACHQGKRSGGEGSKTFQNHVSVMHDLKNGSLSYEIHDEMMDCSTGKHVFASKKELCEGLQDEKLNQGCALALRKANFRQENCSEVANTDFDSDLEKINDDQP